MLLVHGIGVQEKMHFQGIAPDDDNFGEKQQDSHIVQCAHVVNWTKIWCNASYDVLYMDDKCKQFGEGGLE